MLPASRQLALAEVLAVARGEVLLAGAGVAAIAVMPRDAAVAEGALAEVSACVLDVNAAEAVQLQLEPPSGALGQLEIARQSIGSKKRAYTAK